MQRIKQFSLLFLTVLSSLLLNYTCSGPQNKDQTISNKSIGHKKRPQIFKLVQPDRDFEAKLGETISFQFGSKNPVKADSIKLTLRGTEQKLHIQGDHVVQLNTSDMTVGTHNLRFIIYYSDSLSDIISTSIKLFAMNPPVQLKYEIIRKFWHDPEAYTQGLLYHNGSLYESTGHRGQSSLRKIDINSGKVQQKYDLDNQLFGEGIARIGEEIYMLTWYSQRGFIFDINTLTVKRKFKLQTQQGWGLTSHNSELILSDGSEYLYYYDHVYFTQINQMEVCDDKGIVSNLNELEYTHHGIFANIYGDSRIILIDPKSSAVIGEIELTDIFPENMPRDMDHVLNGIAYHKDTDTYFVTGKYWPVMYEINILF